MKVLFILQLALSVIALPPHAGSLLSVGRAANPTEVQHLTWMHTYNKIKSLNAQLGEAQARLPGLKEQKSISPENHRAWTLTAEHARSVQKELNSYEARFEKLNKQYPMLNYLGLDKQADQLAAQRQASIDMKAAAAAKAAQPSTSLLGKLKGVFSSNKN